MKDLDIFNKLIESYRLKYNHSKSDLRFAKRLLKTERIGLAFKYLEFAHMRGTSAYCLKAQLNNFLDCHTGIFKYNGSLDLKKEKKNLLVIERFISLVIKKIKAKPISIPRNHNENLRVCLFFRDKSINVDVDVFVGPHKTHFSSKDDISVPIFDYKKCIISICCFESLYSPRKYNSLQEYYTLKSRCDAGYFQTFAIKNKIVINLNGFKELYDFVWEDKERRFKIEIPLYIDLPDSDFVNHGMVKNFAKNLSVILNKAGIMTSTDYLFERYLHKLKDESDEQILKDNYDGIVNGRRVCVQLLANKSIELDGMIRELHCGNYLICVLQDEKSYVIVGVVLDWRYLPIQILCHEPDGNLTFEWLWDTFCEEVVSLYKISIN